MIHVPHFIKGQQAKGQGVKKHEHAIAKALLDGIQVVGVQAHQVAHLVDLIILLGELAAVVKHPLPQICRDPHGTAKEADAPQKAAQHHQYNNVDHRQADVLEQHLFAKGHSLPVHDHLPQIDPVDHQPVKPGDQKLDVVHRQQCRQAQQKHRSILEVVAVDVLAKDHCNVSLLFLSISKNAHKGEPPCPQGRPGSPYMLFKTERYQYKGIRRFCQHLQTFPTPRIKQKSHHLCNTH